MQPFLLPRSTRDDVATVRTTRRESEAAVLERPTEPLSCDLCGKKYTRIDHLVRHQRSHSDKRPFSCSVCGKEFGRVDVLKRHLTNHDDTEQTSKRRRTLIADGRSRVAKACRACAAAKLKCEDEKPCQRCRQKQVQCIYSTPTPLVDSGNDNWGDSSEVQDDSYNPSPTVPGQIPSGFEFQNVGTDTAISPDRPGSDIVRSFSDPTSQLPSDSPAEIRPGHQATQSLQHLQGNEEIINFPQGLSPDFDESSLAYFLNGIMIPPVSISETQDFPDSHLYQPRASRDFLDFGTFNLDSFDADIALWDNRTGAMPVTQNMPPKPLPTPGTHTPDFRDRIASGNEAFLRSVWMWTPTDSDFNGKDNLNLSLPTSEMDSPETRAIEGHSAFHQCLDSAFRDKILGLVLSTCDSSLFTVIASSFPTAESLNKLMHLYMAVHVTQTDSFLHFPTLELDDRSILLILMIVASGAVICSVPSIRKLGYALQEANRTALAERFEADNRSTRDLATLQSFALMLQVGIWSGDKRKMELAESFAQPLITMLRRAGRFRRPKILAPAPTLEDSYEDLDIKWRQWAHAESYKRLACQVLIHDAQVSMACQVAPLLSPAEFSLGFPASKALWGASNAQEWRILYLQQNLSASDKGLNISQGINSVSLLRDQSNIDLLYAATLVIHNTWALVYSNSLLNSLTRPPSFAQDHNSSAVCSPQNSNIVHLIEQILLNITDWEGSLPPEMALISERTLLNLHVSFEQVQLFAGKEGEEEARRVFPILQQWVESSDARKALWHAGQILKAARRCPAKALREFGSICLYHAGLTFWAYAVVLIANPKQAQSHPQSSQSFGFGNDIVWLDGEDCSAVQRFVSLNRGTPAVHDESESRLSSASLSNPKALMELCISLLRKGRTGMENGDDLPLVENLIQLMRDLGNAAQGLLSGQLRRSNEHGSVSGFATVSS